MVAPLPSQIISLLRTLDLPGMELQEITIQSSSITVRLVFGYPLGKTELESLKTSIRSLLQNAWPGYSVEILANIRIRRHAVQNDLKPTSDIKNIIAIASGKGGVGKSTVAVNVAIALHQLGASVGLLDADIYGPSQPWMLGQGETRATIQHKKILPQEAYGIQSTSIGYLVEPEAAMIWRGPMISGALLQLLNETAWQPCDYLIIDLPPGTGDIALTLAQKIPITGAVMVTTPQTVAMLDVKKSFQMFKKVGCKVLGIVENMSHYQCTQCGHVDPLFGEGGAVQLAQQWEVPLLGQIPCERAIREGADAGCPVVVRDPLGACAENYRAIARRIGVNVAQCDIETVAHLSNIVLEN